MAVLAIAALAGLALQAYGTYQSGRQQKNASRAQRDASESMADLSDYNAAIAELQAEDAIERGMLEEQRFRSQVRGMVGGQRAAFAASNVDVGFGSALDVQADAAFLGELDALTIRTNAAREAWGYEVQAEDYRKRGQILRKEGGNALLAGDAAQRGATIGATGTLLTSASSLLLTRYGGQ